MMLIQRYTANWIIFFEQLKKEIQIGLEGIDCVIEHIGSTAVPELDAKPIIDIDLIYFNPAEFKKISLGLGKLGYYHNGDQGIKQREVFKRKAKGCNKIFDKIDHHLYVCLSGSKPLQRHILSRNFLRKNEWARIKYQEMKYDLAAKAGQDRKIYAALKECSINEFIDRIIMDEQKIM